MKGTIKRKEEIERLFRTGRRSSSSLITVIELSDTQSPLGRCAYIAGKKLGSAPLRNRCKRVMREAARELGAPWPGHDVVFVARRKLASTRQKDLVRGIKEQLVRLDVV